MRNKYIIFIVSLAVVGGAVGFGVKNVFAACLPTQYCLGTVQIQWGNECEEIGGRCRTDWSSLMTIDCDGDCKTGSWQSYECADEGGSVPSSGECVQNNITKSTGCCATIGSSGGGGGSCVVVPKDADGNCDENHVGCGTMCCCPVNNPDPTPIPTPIPPPLPNCNITAPANNSTYYIGNPFSINGTFSGQAGSVSLQGQYFTGTAPSTINSLMAITNLTLPSSNLSLTTWAPSVPGFLPIYCRAWNDGIAECRPTAFVSGPPLYTCVGPTTGITVNVVSPTCNMQYVNCPATVMSGFDFTCSAKVANTVPPTGNAAEFGDTNISWTTTNGTYLSQSNDGQPGVNRTFYGTFRAGAVGVSSVTFRAYMMHGGQSCFQTYIPITVIEPATNWFSAGGGGDVVAAGGGITSKIPVIPGSLFLDSVTSVTPNYSGVAFGTGFSVINVDNVNDYGWRYQIPGVNNPWLRILGKPENTYFYMRERILAKAPNAVAITSDTVNLGSLPTNSEMISGVKIYRYNNQTGTLNLSGNVGSNQILILVEGEVAITGDITVAADGFLAVISRGNITVSDTVGGDPGADEDIKQSAYQADISGVFYTEGTFNTGIINSQLKVEGTVVGMTGVGLQRTGIGYFPREYFSFRPDFLVKLTQVGIRQKIIQELIVN